MNKHTDTPLCWHRGIPLLLALIWVWASPLALGSTPRSIENAVTLTQDISSYTLSNGIVTAKISKHSGTLLSLNVQGQETIAIGIWSHDTTGGTDTLTRVSIDPSTNQGQRGEVSIKGISGGINMGHGPGAEQDGDFPADIEIRYCMEQGQCGLYTYCIFEHLPEYPAQSMTEARFCAGLSTIFDWISVDDKRHKYYPEPIPDEDKYCYTTVQSVNRAFGFSSTTQKLGWWMINPSVEYLSGGPTKVEFLCHRHTDRRAAPVVLNYWRSSHYGGASVTVEAGEHWTKVIGPFLLYINSDGDPNELWEDARHQAELEMARWPYDWVDGVDYPQNDHRSTVHGQLCLNDPWMPGGSRLTGKLTVGLAHAPYLTPSAYGGMREITWQLNAKHYQFWTEVHDSNGTFSIPHVRPGTYTLYAFADGILGEFTQAEITVFPGGDPVNLGQLQWTPIRHGPQLWDIGIPNRTATEFVNGERYFEPGIQIEYTQRFPQDVNYVIGTSDYSQNWYFQHIPHNEDGQLEIAPYRGVLGQGRATPYTVTFNLDQVPRGKLALRLAICGTDAKKLDVQVNGTQAGTIELGIADGVITRHQIQGLWVERELTFATSLLHEGQNQLQLIIPAGSVNQGVIYDYVRLELDQRR